MLTLLTLLACSSTPSDALQWRESWEVLIATQDGGVVDVHAAVGNTGLLRGQGHLNLDRWSRSETPILYGLHGGPEDVDVAPGRDAVRVGTALMGRFETGENWTVRVSSAEANAILHIDPGGPQPPMATARVGDGQWTVTAPITQGPVHGWTTAGKRGGLVKGLAVALHRGGDARLDAPRRAAFAVGKSISIGFDLQGEVGLRWARVGDRDFPVDEGRLSWSSDGSARLDFRPAVDLWVELQVSEAGGIRDGMDHLLPPERWIASAASHRARREVRRATAMVHLEGSISRVPGILLRVD
jgi:hypothetical protein